MRSARLTLLGERFPLVSLHRGFDGLRAAGMAVLRSILDRGGWHVMETVQLRYNWADPDVYEAFMARWSEHLASQFLNRVNVAPGGNVLDVACGTGVLAKALA